jgi:hypothetical protein
LADRHTKPLSSAKVKPGGLCDGSMKISRGTWARVGECPQTQARFQCELGHIAASANLRSMFAGFGNSRHS